MNQSDIIRNPYENEMVETLKRTIKVLDHRKILYWIDCGTLLGLIRDGKIIPWDDDVEIGAWIEEKKNIENCFEDFQNQGLITTKNEFDKLGFQLSDGLPYKFRILFYKIKNGRAGRGNLVPVNNVVKVIKKIIYICLLKEDINRINTKNRYSYVIKTIIVMLARCLPKNFINKVGNIFMYIYAGLKFKERYSFEIPLEYFTDFESKRFYGIELNIPKKAHEYLNYRYGHDWNVPKRYWIDYASVNRAVRHK